MFFSFSSSSVSSLSALCIDVSTSGSSTMFQHLPIPQIESLQQKTAPQLHCDEIL
jgi:hypothetical protein